MQCNIEVPATHKATESEIRSIYEQLQAVPDYRCKRGRRYEAAVVIVIVLLAKLAGEESVSGIAHWARLRAQWLQNVMGLMRLSCANTYAYICAHLDMLALNTQIATYFEQCEQAAKNQSPPACADEQTALEHLAVDGKVLRGSHRQAAAGDLQLLRRGRAGVHFRAHPTRIGGGTGQRQTTGTTQGEPGQGAVLDAHRGQIKEYLQFKLPLRRIHSIINSQLERPISYPAYRYFVRQDPELLNLWQTQRDIG